MASTEAPTVPRGDYPLPLDQRDVAENIVLLCGSCHVEIDKLIQVDELTVAKVREIKQSHEAFVRHVTGLDPTRRTLVLRMLGRVRGTAIELLPETAAAAVLASSERYPSFDLAPDRQGIEIDLRPIPGESAAGPDYYKAASAAIDETLVTRLRPAAEKDAVTHLSIFALAGLPLLVYLGSRIDDTVATDVYQRDRDDETWAWQASSETVEFVHRLDQDGAGDECVHDRQLGRIARLGHPKPRDFAAVLAQTAARGADGSPLYFMLELPFPTKTGAVDHHLLAGRLPQAAADGLRRAVAQAGALAEVTEADLALDTPIEWCRVSDERESITTRRDTTRPVNALLGADVEMWGCGGLGAWIAEFVVLRRGEADHLV